MILSQFEKINKYNIYMQIFIRKFQLKTLPSPFVKTFFCDKWLHVTNVFQNIYIYIYIIHICANFTT
jgi:hypothetical protein